MRQHQESTALQYRLVDRAAALGWPRERIAVIDDDLGKSGASASERGGFQRLIAEIGLGKAGLVLSLDASRLARNNRDWHQLLELCSMFGVVIGDGERLYDPGAYHDRLLLGLSGLMSEAELHQIRVRLHQGERKSAKVYAEDPVAQARSFVQQGAKVLHVVDLDAAFGGRRQLPLIEKIARAAAPALVQVGGGIRDLQAAAETLAAGAGRDFHHGAEAVFKSFARALRQAAAIDPRTAGTVPSTKGVL